MRSTLVSRQSTNMPTVLVLLSSYGRAVRLRAIPPGRFPDGKLPFLMFLPLKHAKLSKKDCSTIHVWPTLSIYNCHFYKGIDNSIGVKPCVACALLAVQSQATRCNLWIWKRGRPWHSNAGQDDPGHLSAHCGCGAPSRSVPAWFVQSRRTSGLPCTAVTAIQGEGYAGHSQSMTVQEPENLSPERAVAEGKYVQASAGSCR